MPTWTAQGDLNLAIYSGHGEFPRCVLAASDIESAYLLIQKAFNIAEKFQVPVLLLTEKQLGESLFNIDNWPEALPIERGLVPADRLENLHPGDRYRITESGVSPRWLPGQSPAHFVLPQPPPPPHPTPETPSGVIRSQPTEVATGT